MTSGYGAGSYGAGSYGDTNFFTPPFRIQVVQLERSLRYSYPVSKTVWKDADGVWHAQEVPYAADLIAAQMVITATGPVEVDSTTAAELIAAGIGTIS